MNVMDKESTKIIKAVAIVLMLLHHFWAFGDSWIVSAKVISIESLCGFPLEKLVGAFGKICVGLFAFMTGYAFFVQKQKFKGRKERFKKIEKFLISYWIIYAIELLLGFLAKEPIPPVEIVLQNLLGFSSKVYEYGTGYVSSCFAWYVYFYILLMVTYPIVTKELKIGFWRSTLIPIIVAVAANSVLAKIQTLPIITPLLNDYFEYMPVVAVGYQMARFNVIGNLVKAIKRKCNDVLAFAISGILFCFCFVLKVKINKIFGVNVDVLCVPILVFLIECLRQTEVIKKANVGGVEKIVRTLAKESMNIWFLHAIFFTPYRSYQFIAVWPRLSILIIIWVTILLIGVSKIITYLQQFVWSRVEKVSNRS